MSEPHWVCFECGNRYGRGYPEGHVCAVHTGVCDICGQTKAVTESRDFGFMKPNWIALREKDTKNAT